MTAYMARALARGEPLPEPHVPSPTELAAWMEAEGLSVAEAARIADVSPRHVGRWLDGTRNIPSWLSDVLAQRWGSAP